MAHDAVGRLLDDRERKSCRTEKKEQRTHAHILLSTHLLEDVGVQTHKSAIETNRQEQIGVIVEITVLGRPKAIGEEDFETRDVDEGGRQHVDIQGKITLERALSD